ncbi:MAG: protein-disulfide reductase DsbD N-terminal domain-containing protein [Betaproteobacteria bacterium]
MAGGALAQPLPLAPNKAFRFEARALNPQTIEARFSIADGYYLYRDRIHFSVEPATVPSTVPVLPEGKVKQDPFFGRVETYRGGVQVNIALKDTVPGQKVVVVVESQGCADVGICYPVQLQRVTVALPAANVAPTRPGQPKSWLN